MDDDNDLTCRDQEYVEKAVNAVPSMLAEIDRLRGVLAEMYETFSKGFTVTEAYGPDKKFHMVSKFGELQDMQDANMAWLNACLEGRKIKEGAA